MEIASNTEHYLKMVGGTIAFRDRRVPAQVSSGSGPAQLIGRSPAIIRCAEFGHCNGLFMECIVVVKLIASDDHYEPY